jgi:hypothetical protein
MRGILSLSSLGVVVLACAAMPACALAPEESCGAVGCEPDGISSEPVDVSEEALEQGLRPDLVCQRVKSPATAHVYLIDPSGHKRWIPDAYTYEKLFVDWNGIQTDLDVIYIPDGAALSSGAELVKSTDSPAVYLFSNGCKSWISSPALFDKCHFSWQKIHTYDPLMINSIANCPSW